MDQGVYGGCPLCPLYSVLNIFITPFMVPAGTSERKDFPREENGRGVRYCMQQLWRALHRIDSQKLEESERTSKRQTSSAVCEHQSKANHEINWEEIKILDQEIASRNKRFCLASEQGKIEERDFWFWPREKWNLSSPTPPRSFPRAIFARSLTIVPRSLLQNRAEALALAG